MTRRARRANGGTTDASGTLTLPFSDETEVAPREWADQTRPATALAWLETADVEESTLPADLNAITMTDPGPDLLSDAKLRPALLSGRWLAPLGTLAALAIAYCAT